MILPAHGAQNIVMLLERDGRYYRNFGIWWFAIKRFLKESGYTQANLPHLGEYTDPVCTAYYEGASDAELLQFAIAYQMDHVFAERNSPHCMAPDGEAITVWDADAEA